MSRPFRNQALSRFILASAVLVAAAAAVSAQTVNVNCGGNDMVTSDGTHWSADSYYTGGDLLYTGYTIANTNPQDLYLYRSARAGLYGDFSYNIPVPNGSYTVTLKMAEIQFSNKGERVFNVAINGVPALSNFDILAHAAPLTAFDQQFPVTVTNGAVKIDVQGVVRKGILSAIQIATASGTVQPPPPPAPVLSLTAGSLSFTGTAGASNPASKSFSVSNTGTGTMAWTAASNQNWLTVSPASGSDQGTISVQPNVAGLAAGTYTASVTVTAPGAAGSPAAVAVTFVVAPAQAPPSTQASININCGGWDLTGSDGTKWTGDQYYTGGDLLYTGYSIANTNAQDLGLLRSARAGLYGDFGYAIPVANGSYTVTLRFAEIQFSNKGERVFNVLINGTPVLSNFDILASVPPLTPLVQQFPATVTNGVLQIDVTGVVRKGILNAIQVSSGSSGQVVPASLILGGTALSFNGTSGGSNPAAQNVSVSNGGGSVLNWSASSSQSWLGVSPASGTAPGSISLQPNLSGLAAGTYTAAVTVNAPGAGNAPQTITVSLTVAAPAPVLTVSSSSMSFATTVGGSSPAAQTADVSNTGGGTLSWTASSNQSWLSVSPASGSNSGTLTIGAGLGALAAGTYSGAIAVSGGGSTKTIGVTFTVAGTTQVNVGASPSIVGLSANTGSNASSQMLAVSCAPSTAGWTASKTKPWLTLSQASGTGAGNISLGTQTTGMTAGTYTDTVTIAPTAAGSAATVSVTLTITDPSTPPPSSGSSWYVSTSGSPSGTGSISNPWDIVTALAQPAAVKPGDTIWVRGGRYGGGTSSSVINSTLVGTASAPIVVRAYPKERAIIDAWLEIGCCDGAPNPAAGSYTWFWGLEFAGYNTNRTSGTSGPPEWAAQFNHNGADTWGAGTKLINCIVHDTGGGFSVWNAANTEVYGNIIYNVGGYGTDRGHGHDFYLQNAAPSILKATDNIGFNNFDMGMQAYASSDVPVQNIQLQGNIIFNSGILYGQIVDNLTLGGGSGGPSGMVVDTNFFYSTPTLNQGYNELGFLWTPRAHDAVVTNNYFIGGYQAIDLERWDTLTFTNNYVYSQGIESMMITRDDQTTAPYIYGSNHYYGSGMFWVDPQCDNWPCPQTNVVNFTNWMATTGLDSTSSFSPGAPTGLWTTVRPNTYEPGRANIVIFNWDLKPSVQVDLSNSGIKAGDQYQIRDAQNWFNGAVVSGTYSGSPVSIPMTGLQVVQPVGSVPNPPTHTAPQFGTFVLLSGSALQNVY
jgi:hypothetical protein